MVSNEVGDSSGEGSHIGEEGEGVCDESREGMNTQPFPVHSLCDGDGLVEKIAGWEGEEEEPCPVVVA